MKTGNFGGHIILIPPKHIVMESEMLTEQWLVGGWEQDMELMKCKSFGMGNQSQRV